MVRGSERGRDTKYLEKGWGESRWKRIARYRLGNEMKGDIGKRKAVRYVGCVEKG